MNDRAADARPEPNAAGEGGGNIVTMTGLWKSFGKFEALRNINLDIRKGEILTFLGPSGCGKSTLLRIIAGFIDPSSGELLLKGKDMARMPPEKRPVNMVFQRYALFPHLDVFDNIAFGLRLKRMPEADVRRRVLAMMELVQLDEMADRWINELSGGQSQRVALARALVNQPEVLLLDEPLAALDLKIRHLMLAELKRIQQTTGTTFVYVTHDQDEAMILSSRVVLMDHGVIEQVGTPDELYFHPESLFAAKFLGETNIIPGNVVERTDEGVVVSFDGGTAQAAHVRAAVSQGDKVHISVRPVAIHISAAEDGIAHGRMQHNSCLGVLSGITPIGGRIVYNVKLDGGIMLRAQHERAVEIHPYRLGQTVRLGWSADAMAVLTH